MHRRREEDMADGRTLATDLRALVNSRKYSDVTFVVGDPEKSVDSFSAHKAVLASRCDYFEELFTAKPDSAILSLPELEGPTFRKVSCFLNNLLVTSFLSARFTNLLLVSKGVGVSLHRTYGSRSAVCTLTTSCLQSMWDTPTASYLRASDSAH